MVVLLLNRKSVETSVFIADYGLVLADWTHLGMKSRLVWREHPQKKLWNYWTRRRY